VILAALLVCHSVWCGPDYAHLRSLARQSGANVRAVLAIAYEESAHNLNPRVRGKHGEVGRFQIKTATARERCPDLNIWTYQGNTTCFVRMFSEDTRRVSTEYAIRAQNGAGPGADLYARKVLADMQRLELRGEP
jgi:hypothetical protein